MRVYNERILTIEYKQSTRQSLFFFDAKKESKKHLGNPPKPPNALRLILFLCLVSAS